MKKLLPALLVLLLAIVSCKKEQPSTPNPVAKKDTIAKQPATPSKLATATISRLSPSSGTVGTTVIISGTEFGTYVTSVSVLFNGVAATIHSVTDTTIQVTVPVTTTGNVTLKIGSETILGPIFTYTNPATLTGISPSSGTAGTIVTLSGTNFGTSTAGVSVSFNGVPAIIQSVTDSEIKAVAPISTSGAINLTIGNQKISGASFTYASPLIAPYVSGDVILKTQAEVDAFVALNKGRQLQITGSLSIYGNDITSVLGLSNITSVSGTLSIGACPLLTDVSFLNNITSASRISLQNLVVSKIAMDKLTGTVGNIFLSSCKNLSSISFKSLTNITGIPILGSLRIVSCDQLANADFSSLSAAATILYISGTALSDLSGFGALQTAGALNVTGNPALTSLRGLEHLTTLTLEAITPSSYGGSGINGIYIISNAKLTSLDGLQNLMSVPIASISSNANLNDFCTIKVLIGILNSKPAYNNINNTSAIRTSVPALTMTNNGNYPTTQKALEAVALCK